MRNMVLLLIFVLLSQVLIAQSGRNTYKAKKNYYDPAYIKSYNKYVNIENSISRNGLNVLIGEIGGRRIRYAINQKVQLGYKLNWRFVSFSFGVNIPFFNNNEDKYGKTSGFNFNFATQIKRKVLLDIYFLKQKSLFVSNASSLIDNFDINGTYPIFKDLEVNYLGIDADYLFNNKEFTFKAPLNSNERQLKSSGSFTLGGYFFFSQIKNKSGLLNDSLEISFKELRNVISNASYNFGVSAGYGYNFVIKKHGLISTIGHIGFGPGISEIKYENGIEKNKIMLSGRYKLRLTGAYMNDNISAGIRTIVGILPNSANNNIRVYYETDQISFFFSYRFLPNITKNKILKNNSI